MRFSVGTVEFLAVLKMSGYGQFSSNLWAGTLTRRRHRNEKQHGRGKPLARPSEGHNILLSADHKNGGQPSTSGSR